MDANYNLAGLVNRIKTRLKDVDYDDDTIKQFINDAYFEIVGETHYPFLEKTNPYQTFIGGKLPLPQDFQSVFMLTRTDKDGIVTKLDYNPAHTFFERKPGSPVNQNTFTVYGNNVYFVLDGKCPLTCTPDCEDADLYTMMLYYLAKPQSLVNDTDVPAIPSEYGEVIVLGALARAEQLRDNFDFATIYENKKNEILTNLNERYGPRQLQNENFARPNVRVHLGV